MVPVTPEYPEDADILSVHDREYLNRLETACRRGDLTLDSEDTYLNRHSFNIALLSAGGAIAGAKAVAEGTVDRAFCAIRPPGHHAGRDVGMGFCLLNNAAVAARYLQARHGVGKVLIVDWDVHHGNGTQNIFLEDPTVFYFSIHEHPTFLYPGTGRRWEIGKGKGEGATLNAPMAPGAGDGEFRTTFEQTLDAGRGAVPAGDHPRLGGVRRAPRRPAGGPPGDGGGVPLHDPPRARAGRPVLRREGRLDPRGRV